MICLFESTKATTNEEYRKSVESKIKGLTIVTALGALTFAFALLNEINLWFGEDHWLNGVYTGLGFGIVIASLYHIIKNIRLLKNEKALKESRLKLQDERNVMIAGKAVHAATLVMLIVTYICMLVMGFISRTGFMLFVVIIVAFGLSYRGFKFYFSRKM